MRMRPHLLDDTAGHVPAACAAGNREPFQKPDYRGKKHPKPVDRNRARRRWERQPRQMWEAV